MENSIAPTPPLSMEAERIGMLVAMGRQVVDTRNGTAR